MGGLVVTIPGSPPSKSNSYKTIRIRGHMSLAKSDEAVAYEQLVRLAARALIVGLGFDPPLFPTERIMMTIHYHQGNRRRRDIDNIAKSIKDALTGEAWTDDSQVDSLNILRAYDASSRGEEWIQLTVRPLAV